MMLTLELKAQFEELARGDHLLRVCALLTELDAHQQYATRAEFPDAIRQWVDELGLRGICSAYQQACVIFSAMASDFSIDSLPERMDAQSLLAHCVSNALQAGVPRGAFQHIHRALSCVGAFNAAWVCTEPEQDCLNTLSNQLTIRDPIDVPCAHAGYTGGASSSPSFESVHDQATFLRTASGFQHKVSAAFPVPRLLSQVCQSALSTDPWCISPNPVFDQCEIGMGSGNAFVPVHKLRLLDSRQAGVAYQNRGLMLPDSARQRLESRWKQSALLRENAFHLNLRAVQADLAFSARWTNHASGFVFATQGELAVSLSADSIQWQGSLVHEGCLVQLGIALPQDFRMNLSLESDFPVGQLPLGSPLLIRQHDIPLQVQVNSAICVGKPVVNCVNPIAGYLSIRLVACIDPVTRRLGLTLHLSHSQLLCEWWAVDALLGWTSGKWSLLPDSPIQTWDLHDG